jgi:uncharacterized cupin superfamily protein
MSTPDAVFPKLVSTSKMAWTDWAEVPRISERYKHLSLATLGKDYRVGVVISELAPGKQSSPAHYHIFEEEHVYILEGELTLRLGDRTYPMKAGDYVCFPAGQQAGHCLINDGAAPCRYVIVGERNPNEVVVYPDSNKVLVRALGRRAIFDMAAMRGYWDGEETGLADGETPPADNETPATERPPPKPPISFDEAPWHDETGAGTRFGGVAKHFTYAAVGGDYHVGVLIEAPAPGKRLAPNHYHMLEEEHALILEGQLTLFLGDERYEMKPGDFISFPAGRKVGHSFVNSGTGPCRYLMIGEHNPNEVCVYPDSNKMAVAALRSTADIFGMSQPKRYWDDEEIG